MIISDLEHIEVVSEAREIEGSFASITFKLEFLSIGSLISMANITQAEFLTTESPGIAISSGKFGINMVAGGQLALALGI